jgi:hypothetical protein
MLSVFGWIVRRTSTEVREKGSIAGNAMNGIERWSRFTPGQRVAPVLFSPAGTEKLHANRHSFLMADACLEFPRFLRVVRGKPLIRTGCRSYGQAAPLIARVIFAMTIFELRSTAVSALATSATARRASRFRPLP